ncbi:NAD(P)H-binding protein [Saccharopolyspora sp. NFXS83]|uniref:NmrA family NAD(P)-binding protein n=1 Tax=Saccharopolyspora sp. NFXS83 TaxID=2993560 RepID=UPI00224A6454|nr:NAD(P)H-binding protein [Saccharopolyspora sp. NFXS83]MCX2733587.1 NAD(P)H-binding protein [Saccharopolyspora sp. NFXS83]
MTVLVTGATGSIGRGVVRRLLAAGEQVRAVTRRPETARLPAEADVVAGDLADPGAFREALRGVRAVYLFPVPETAREFADLAVRSGVRRIVVLSSLAASGGPEGNMSAATHSAVERAVEESGVAERTFLRPGAFASNVLGWAESIRAEGVVRAPHGSAAQALIHEEDIAEVAAAALLTDDHVGATYELSGPAAVSQVEQVAAISVAIGEPLRFEELAPEQARQQWSARGMPPEVAAMLLDYLAEAVDSPDVPLPAVRQVTGHPARAFADWATDHAADFR